MIDITCVDASEGLFAVFMDEAGVQSMSEALVRMFAACASAGDDQMCLFIEGVVEELEGVHEWALADREARVCDSL